MKEGHCYQFYRSEKHYKRVLWKLYDRKLHKLDEIDKLETHNLPRLNHKENFKNLYRP